ncbi:MAG: TetR/AcrR family transcriptional regulator [Paracoccaceae bacterium]
MRKTAEARRADITEAALVLLATAAPEQLTTTRIARKVGISQAALFRHFPTKDHVWRAVVEEIEARAERAWAKAAEIGGSPAQRLRILLLTQLGLIEQTPAMPALVFSPGRHVSEDAVRPVILRVMAGLQSRIVALVEEGAAGGAAASGLQPADIALLLMGTLQGLVLRWSLSGRGFDLVSEGDRLIQIQIGLLAPCRTPEET